MAPQAAPDSAFDMAAGYIGTMTKNDRQHNDRQNTESAVRQARLARLVARMESTSVVDMGSVPQVADSRRVYTGRIFAVDDQKIRLEKKDGTRLEIGRQVIRHSHAAIMLVHNVADDTYIVEREYRVGSNSFSFGLPAGLVDPHESALMAAFRELREETGLIVPGVPSGTGQEREAGLWTAENVEKSAADSPDVTIDTLGTFFSSVGMTDEQGTLFVLHLRRFEKTDRHFDPDEHVESAWAGWDDMRHVIPFHGTTANLLLAHEEIRRMRQGSGRR